jgi:hypothetical protein
MKCTVPVSSVASSVTRAVSSLLSMSTEKAPPASVIAEEVKESLPTCTVTVAFGTAASVTVPDKVSCTVGSVTGGGVSPEPPPPHPYKANSAARQAERNVVLIRFPQ